MEKAWKRVSHLALVGMITGSLALISLLVVPPAKAHLPGPGFSCFVDSTKNVRAGCCREPEMPEAARYQSWLCDINLSTGETYWSYQGHFCVPEIAC